MRLLLCCACSLFLSLLARAEPIGRIQGLVLDADDMYRDTEADTVELTGHVQIVSQDRHLQAEKARILLRSRQVELTGNVRLTTGKSTIGGSRMVLDYESATGLIYDGYVQSGSVIFEGTVIEKTGPDEFFVVEANYTTCTNCPSAWAFKGTSIRAELGGYAYIRNSVLKFGTLPVLWLPYLVVPLKSDRQSGLLTPEFETGSAGGLAIGQPYFWAISRSTDATFTLRNYELRGLKGLANYRYVLDDNSGGELDLSTIRDRVFISDDRVRLWRTADQQDTPFDRWLIHYRHYQELPSGWVHRMTINNASDLQYPNDFFEETRSHGDPSMESRASMTKNTLDTHFSVDSSYELNLLQGNPMAGNEDAVHRLPEVRYAQIPRELGRSGFFYSLDLDYTNFTRSGPAYDHLQSGKLQVNGVDQGPLRWVANTCANGGVYDPGDPGNPKPTYGSDPQCRAIQAPYDPTTDLIRTGQRFNIEPTLSYPITLGNALDLMPKVSYRETHYNFPVGDETNSIRRYVRTELGGRTSFSRVYGDFSDPKGSRWKHEIRPEVTYTVLPWIEHKSHPFFGFTPQTEAPTFESLSVSDDDLAGTSGLQFDYRDRIYDRNLITYSLVNTLIEKHWVNDAPVYRQVALIRLSQSYDQWKDSTNDPKKEPWSDISALVDLRFDRMTANSLIHYFPYQKVTNSTSMIRVYDEIGRFVQVGMNKAFKIVAGEPVDSDTRVEKYNFGGGFVSRYLNLMGRFTFDSRAASNQIESWTYIAQFKPPGNCWLISLIHNQPTDSEARLRLNFEFSFDGVPKPPLPPETLDQYGF